MDEKIVALAKLKASEQGKSFDALVEEGLRLALRMPPQKNGIRSEVEGDPLEPNDPFFAALDEIRDFGRTSGNNRRIDLDR